MSFAHPLWILLTPFAVLACALLYRWFARRASARTLAYSNVAFVVAAMRPARFPAVALATLYLAGIAALGTALAGPRFNAYVPLRDGIVMLCIDTSGSMRAEDVAPSREEAAKAATLQFVNDVPDGTRVGIVTFSTGASLVQAPTSELDQVREAVDRIPAADGATAMGDALELAAQQMPLAGRRAIVLLTDGVNNRGADPLEASRKIGAQGITIYTVGVGSAGSGQLIPGTNELADLDENALRQIAANGGGTYAAARDADALSAAFHDFARKTVWERHRVDGSLWFAVGGAVALALSFLAGLWTGRLA